MRKVPKILVIAASDPCGGAGIQADISTSTALGAYAFSVVTGLTVQNTQGVQGVHAVATRTVRSQLAAIMADARIDVVKIGALVNAGIVTAVAEALRQRKVRRVVVDPVIVPKSGPRLLSAPGVRRLVSDLLPITYLVTPNLPEAMSLCSMEIRDEHDMRAACHQLHGFGAKNVLLKGGHLKGAPADILYDGRSFRRFVSRRIRSAPVHGTGCVYASAIATYVASGLPLTLAVRNAKRFISRAISRRLSVGRGAFVLNVRDAASRRRS